MAATARQRLRKENLRGWEKKEIGKSGRETFGNEDRRRFRVWELGQGLWDKDGKENGRT